MRVVGTFRCSVGVIVCLVRRGSGGIEFCLGWRFFGFRGESAVCILCWGCCRWWCGDLGGLESGEVFDTLSGAWISISRGLGWCAS